jgi:hypothetical protein
MEQDMPQTLQTGLSPICKRAISRPSGRVAGRTLLGAFVLSVAMAAVAAAATLPQSALGDEPLKMFMLLVLAACVGARAIHISCFRIEITAGDAFMFCGLVLCGPMAACLIAAGGVLGAIAFSAKQPKPIRALFNLATMVLASAVAGHAYLTLPELLSPGNAGAMLALLSAAAVFAFINTAAVAAAIRLERGTALAQVWMGFAPIALSSTFASLLIGLGLNALVSAIGAAGLVAGIAGAAVLRASAQAFRNRVADKTRIATDAGC